MSPHCATLKSLRQAPCKALESRFQAALKGVCKRLFTADGDRT